MNKKNHFLQKIHPIFTLRILNLSWNEITLQGLYEMFKADQGQWCKTNYFDERITQAVTFSSSMN